MDSLGAKAVGASIELSQLARAMRGRVLIDPYRLFDPAAVAAAGLVHFTLGRA